jgi:putative ABC transport system permease protein
MVLTEVSGAPSIDAGRRFRVADLLREALASLRMNPFRSFLVTLGTVLAAAALVATSGISATLSQQVSSEFDAVRATEILVTVASGAQPTDWTEEHDLARVRSIPGVLDAGVMMPAETFAAHRPPGGVTREVKVRAVDAAAVRILHPRLVVGRTFDSYHVASRSDVIMLSRAVADRLQSARPGAVIELDGRTLTVVGIYDEVERRPETLLEALVPLRAVPADRSSDEAPQVLLETAPGAAPVVAKAVASALHPEDPTSLVPSSPLDPTSFRRGIEDAVAQLAFGVVLICLMMGAVSIAGAAMASVYARTSEIGLRCVVGARPRHIFAQLITETFSLGSIGGVLGCVLGLIVIVAVCTWNGWAPVIDVGFLSVAVASGALSGFVAGLLPAWRAMRLQPVDALRR